MRLEGTFPVKSPPQRVYAFLLSPEDLSSCIDDPHTIQVQDADHFKGTIRTGVGFIKGTFTLSATILERSPPRGARLKVQGSGMGSGFDIDATLDLSESSGVTTVRWLAEVRLNGPIASLGARLVQGTVDKKAAAFFGNARKRLETA